MGEYFRWVNIDKKEYLEPADFGCGSKAAESLHRESPVLHALAELLDRHWRGSRIVFLGDECPGLAGSAYPVIRALEKQTAPEHYSDYIFERYRNVSGLFRTAEVCVRENIAADLEELKTCPAFPNEYGIDAGDPFAGLFQKNGRRFCCTLNHTKKVYYFPDTVKVLREDGRICTGADPLPMLLAYGRSADPGAWLGDSIGVLDTAPAGYTLLPVIQTGL